MENKAECGNEQSKAFRQVWKDACFFASIYQKFEFAHDQVPELGEKNLGLRLCNARLVGNCCN